jgi:hypothetical protein
MKLCQSCRKVFPESSLSSNLCQKCRDHPNPIPSHLSSSSLDLTSEITGNDVISKLKNDRDTILKELDRLKSLAIDRSLQNPSISPSESLPFQSILSLQLNFPLPSLFSQYFTSTASSILGWSREKPNKTYKLEKNNVFGPTIVVIKGKIWLIGGMNAVGVASSQIIIFDTKLQNVTNRLALVESRKFAAAVNYKGKIFVIGGMNSSEESVNKIEVLDSETETFLRVFDDIFIPAKVTSACLLLNTVFIASPDIQYVVAINLDSMERRNINKPSVNAKKLIIAQFEGNIVILLQNKDVAMIDQKGNEVKILKGRLFRVNWVQSECIPWENGVFFKDFLGETNKISLI